jgi:hypothetical protein
VFVADNARPLTFRGQGTIDTLHKRAHSAERPSP